MLDIYLLHGAPGAGKGSVTKKLDKSHVFAIGEFLRSQNLGGDGTLLNDDYINQLVSDKLLTYNDYVVIDGYPRTVSQANFIKNCPNVRIMALIHLYVDDKEMIERVSLRETCTCGCVYHPKLKPSKVKNICDACGLELFHRKDDNPETIKKRLELFHQEEQGILSAFKDKTYTVNMTNKNLFNNVTTVANMIKDKSINR